MFKEKFQYAVLYYIPDLKRGENVNFGIIMQRKERGKCEARLKANENFSPKPDFDKRTYQKWLEYFRERIEELKKENSQDIIASLKAEIKRPGNYNISEQGIFEAESGSLEKITEYMYQQTCGA